MTVLEFLAAAAGTRVVGTRHLVCTVRSVACLLNSFTGILPCGGSLTGIVKVYLFFIVTLRALLGSSLLHFLGRLHLRNLTAHEHTRRTVVHVVNHVVPQLHALQFEDEQRVFLLVGSILDGMTEVIQLAEVLLPVVVNDMEQDYLLELFDDLLALAFIGFLQVAGNVVDTLAVGDWHHDAFVHRPLIFINLLDDRPCDGLDALGLAH